MRHLLQILQCSVDWDKELNPPVGSNVTAVLGNSSKGPKADEGSASQGQAGLLPIWTSILQHSVSRLQKWQLPWKQCYSPAQWTSPGQGGIKKFSFQPPAASELSSRRTPSGAMAPATQLLHTGSGLMCSQPCCLWAVLLHWWYQTGQASSRDAKRTIGTLLEN